MEVSEHSLCSNSAFGVQARAEILSFPLLFFHGKSRKLSSFSEALAEAKAATLASVHLSSVLALSPSKMRGAHAAVEQEPGDPSSRGSLQAQRTC